MSKKTILTFREFSNAKRKILNLVAKYDREKDAGKKSILKNKIQDLQNVILLSGNFEQLFKTVTK